MRKHRLLLVCAALQACLLILPDIACAADTYRLIYGPDNPMFPNERKAQARMCRAVVKKLNQTKYEPPFTCKRKFDPHYSYFPVPDWKPLSGADALQAALAREKIWAAGGPPKEFESRFAQNSARVRKLAETGQLKAWEATFDIVKNGEQARVVLLYYGEVKVENECYYETHLAVLLPDRFEADKRYDRISVADGEIIIDKGTAYIARWKNVPSATRNNRAGPRGPLHQGYLLIQSLYWAPKGPAVEEGAMVYDTVCQISYGRVIGHQQ